MADNTIPEAKVCTKCGEVKPLDSFYAQAKRKDGRTAKCVLCLNRERREKYASDPTLRAKRKAEYALDADRARARAREWRENNLERAKARSRAWSAANLNRHREATAAWREANAEKLRLYSLEYHRANRDEILRKNRERRQENPEHYRSRDRAYNFANPEVRKGIDQRRRSTPKGRLEHSISSNVHRGLKIGSKAGRRAFDLLGYSSEDLRNHLEKQFLPGMSWDNYGKWHIDHIVPLSAFNYSTPQCFDFGRAWALSNLRPLWAEDNLRKNDKLIEPFQPSLL